MSEAKLIHMGRIDASTPSPLYLSLRQLAPYRYVWFFIQHDNLEIETSLWGATIEEAIRLAYRYWKLDNFRTLHCGFIYNLPERDEHGTNALFHQMMNSYLSPSGVFFNEDIGCNCIVNNASLEARKIMKNYIK